MTQTFGVNKENIQVQHIFAQNTPEATHGRIERPEYFFSLSTKA